eukprot:6468576-Amphidinium_carterae.1
MKADVTVESKSWSATRDEKRNKEIELWLPLLLASPHTTEVGRMLEGKRLGGQGQTNLRKLLKGMLSSRDPLTLSQHRRAIVKRSAFVKQKGIPATLSDLTNYLSHLHEVKAVGSASIQIYRTALFVEHVLGGLIKKVDQSAVVKGLVAAARMQVRHKVKRRPLEVLEVLALENVVLCEEEA